MRIAIITVIAVTAGFIGRSIYRKMRSFKIKREVADRFEKACEAAGVSQAAQITELMLSFAKEQEEKNTK